MKAKKTNKKSTYDQKDGGLIVIPYVGGLSESTERIFQKYGISTAVKPYKTLRNLLVHPKHKLTVGQTSESNESNESMKTNRGCMPRPILDMVLIMHVAPLLIASAPPLALSTPTSKFLATALLHQPRQPGR